MRLVLVSLVLLVPLLIVANPAHASSCTFTPAVSESYPSVTTVVPVGDCSDANPARATAPLGKVVGTGLIYLHANDEAKYSSLNNVLNAIAQLEGKYIYPGEVFSFNAAAGLLEMQIPYELGPDVKNNLVKAGGVCMVSTLVATAAHDAGLPFINSRGRLINRPVPHSRYYKYYHQVNEVGGRTVPIVEAAVSIRRDTLDKPWETLQDMQFINTTGQLLVLHFEPSFDFEDLDLTQPLGLVQTEHTLKIELRAAPTGLDGWFYRLNGLDF